MYFWKQLYLSCLVFVFTCFIDQYILKIFKKIGIYIYPLILGRKRAVIYIVGTSHSATGAIESALKYVSPDAHWIAHRLATAGGKTNKNAAPQRNRQSSYRPPSKTTFGPPDTFI
jgi:hypothetical protein